MINTFIFDIGNVLVPFNWKEVFAELFDEKTAKIIADATVLRSNLWNEFDRGSKTDSQIMESFYQNAPEYKEQIDLAVWEIYRRMKPYDYSSQWLSFLKSNGYKVYLLSNFGRTSFKLAEKSFDFLKYVDGAIISYQVEQIKPNPAIYMILCQKYGISPCDAVFIDDNPDNIDAAEQLGFNTILFTGMDEALKALGNMGVYF